MIALPPQIDYSRIVFPSDRITVPYLRKAFPRRDSQDSPGFFGMDMGEDIDTMMYLERGFARLGFASALGGGEEVTAELEAGFEGGLQDRRDDLADSYIQFKLADGPKTARQLIRAVQEAGAAQAREHGGKSP
jgi:hypothetical protein